MADRGSYAEPNTTNVRMWLLEECDERRTRRLELGTNWVTRTKVLALARYVLLLSAATPLIAGCGGLPPPIGAPGAGAQQPSDSAHAPGSPSTIQHIVVLVQEGRTYNDLFAQTKVGCIVIGDGKHSITETIHLREVNLAGGERLRSDYKAYRTAYNNGTNCGWNLIRGVNGAREGRAPYKYVNPTQIRPYLTAASDYARADHMFQTQGSGGFTAHQDLIRGGTAIDPHGSVIDSPSMQPWGCWAPSGATTNLITTGLKYEPNQGPFPCFAYPTLGTLLDAKSISWKCYTPFALPKQQQAALNDPDPFFAIQAVWDNPREFATHISFPETNVLSDIAKGALPAMSWVIPSSSNSDDPGNKIDAGPTWVAGVVNAIGNSSYWDSTAIVVVWDDGGGLYDPLPPPFFDKQGGSGFRVPMILISPYVAQGYVSHDVYGFGSIVRFVEDTWSLGRLGTTDTTSTSIGKMFDFHQSPRQFVSI